MAETAAARADRAGPGGLKLTCEGGLLDEDACVDEDVGGDLRTPRPGGQLPG